MFCKECGTKLPDDALFCHECGTKVAGKVQTVREVPTPVPSGKSIRPYFKYVGMIAPILAFFTFFLNWMELSSGIISDFGNYLLGKDGSYTYLALAQDSEQFGLVMAISIIPLVVTVLLQALNHPRFSLIGCFFMMIPTGLVGQIMAVGAQSYYKYAIGSTLYILMLILSILAGILTKAPGKPKK